MPIEIILGETHREPNGLAMSSRNKYLSADEKQNAGAIFAVMCKGDASRNGGVMNEGHLVRVT